MADPLSIPTTILPGSTFDPVQFAKERRQEVLTEQKEKRERYNKAWESVGTPSGMNRNIQQELINERNQVFDEAAAKSAEGINLTDISHPKYGKDAMDFMEKLQGIKMKIAQSNTLDEYLATLRNTIAKDDKKVIDIDATNKNIATLKSLKNMDEINKFMSEKGDDLLVLKKPEFDVDEYITGYMKNKGIKGIEKSIGDKKGNYLFTDIYNEIPKEQVIEMFTDMLKDPEFSKGIKEMRSNDASDVRGGSDLDYILERRGNKVARQDLKFIQKYVEPDKAGKEDEKPVEQSSEPEKLTIIRQEGGKEIPYSVTGDNTYTYDQSKTPNLRLGTGVIDVNTGTLSSPKNFVDFTPISSSEYYAGTVKTRGKSLFETVDQYRIFPNASGNAKKKRFVLGTYIEGTGDKAEKKTVLVPYDNIKNTLDKVYGIKGGLPVSEEQVRYELNGSIYAIPKSRVNDFLKDNPTAKASK